MKKPPAVAVVLLVVSQLSAPTASPACVFSPPLWDVVASADLIVLARVKRVESDFAPTSRDGLDSRLATIAVLEVIDTWKGVAPDDLRVSFPHGSGPQYASDRILLAFLERGESRARQWRDAAAEVDTPVDAEPAADDESDADGDAEPVVPYETGGNEESPASDEPAWTAEDEAGARAEREQIRAEDEQNIRRFETWSAGRWLAIDTPYGLVSGPGEDRDRLRALVQSAAALQACGSVSEEDRRAWLVSAAEHPATRRDVLWELLAQRSRLSKANFENLAASFERSPALDETDVVMLKIFRGRPDLEVDRAAASVVEAGVRMQRVPAWVVSFLQETLRRYGDDFGARIGRDDRDPRGRPIYTGPGENTLWTIWEVARRDLGIPEVPPAAAPPKPSWAWDPYAPE
jgi:hypothetical protein